MRKFTKEIASLLTTVTMSLSVNVSSASSEENVQMAGQALNPDVTSENVPEELTQTAGVVMRIDDDQPITTTTTEIPAMIGTTTAKKSTTTTTTTTTGLIGTTIADRETTTSTTAVIGTTTALVKITTTTSPTITPSMIGTTMVANDTTVTTTTEEFPPLAGVVALPDGDANCDGDLDMSDAVIVMQSLANPNKYGVGGTDENHLTPEGERRADMNGDGLTVSDALAIQEKLLGLE